MYCSKITYKQGSNYCYNTNYTIAIIIKLPKNTTKRH